jgi:hypothetical protein
MITAVKADLTTDHHDGIDVTLLIIIIIIVITIIIIVMKETN